MPMLNLPELRNRNINNDFIRKAGIALSESESGIARALDLAGSVILIRLANMASAPDGALLAAELVLQHESRIIESPAFSFDKAAKERPGCTGKELLEAIFEDSSLIDILAVKIADLSKIKASGARSLFSPAAVQVLQAAAEHAPGSKLAPWLARQKKAAASTLPSGFGLYDSRHNAALAGSDENYMLRLQRSILIRKRLLFLLIFLLLIGMAGLTACLVL